MSQADTITNDIELHKRIMKLNYHKAEQEIVIKRHVQELIYSMHPSVIFEKFASKFSRDTKATHNVKSVALNVGKDFLINKLFGRSIKGFLSSLLMRKASDYIINNRPETIDD